MNQDPDLDESQRPEPKEKDLPMGQAPGKKLTTGQIAEFDWARSNPAGPGFYQNLG